MLFVFLFFSGIPKVRHLINFDLPARIQTYLKNINMTANWGKLSTFYDDQVDFGIAGDLAQYCEMVNQMVPEFLNDIGPQPIEHDDEW